MGNFDFGFYFSMFRRRFPVFVLVAVIVAILGVIVTFAIPRTYVASSSILVESPGIPVDLAKSTVPTSPMEQIKIISQEVLSRDSIIALADRFHVYGDQSNLSPAQIVDDMRARIGIDPELTSGGPGDPATMIFHVSFKAPNAALSADVTNYVVSSILKRDEELRTGGATATLKFFTYNVDRLDTQLKAIEGTILQFKNAHIDALPDSLDFRREQQTNMQQRLLVLSEEEARLRRQISDLKTAGRVQGGPISPDEKALGDMQQAMASQLVTFADNSPTIVSLKSRIATLQARIKSEGAASTATDETQGQSSVALQMATINDRLAAIAKERSAIGSDYAKLAQTILATPANAIALNSLERTHKNIQDEYNADVAKLAEASTGQQIELRLKGERLSLIEAALPPLNPSKPNRKLMLAGSFFAALFAGLGAIFLPELFNRSVRRPVELMDKLEIRTFVTIPYIPAPKNVGRIALESSATVVMIIFAISVLTLPHSKIPPGLERAPTAAVATLGQIGQIGA